MKIFNNHLPRFAGGEKYEPDEDGFVEIPDDVAKAEGMIKTKVKEEVDPEKESLVDEAVNIVVAYPKGDKPESGKPVPPSVLAKWSKDRLVEAIAARKAEVESQK